MRNNCSSIFPLDEPVTAVAASPQSSGELSDPEDFRRKILEILSEPAGNPEQMRRLINVVIEAKGERGRKNYKYEHLSE